MSGENKKGKNLLLAVLPWVAAIVIGVTANMLGLCLAQNLPWSPAAYCICLVLLILIPLLSKLYAALYSRKMGKMNVKGINDLVDQEKAVIEADVRSAWKKLHRNCVLTRGFLGFYGLLTLAVCFFEGAVWTSATNVTGLLLGIYVLNSYCNRLVFSGSEKPETPCVPEEEFPLLYALVRDVAGEERKDMPIRIWLLCDIPSSECTAAVGVNDGHIDLHLGIMLLNVLTEEELRQVLLHEFSHLNQQDSHQLIFYNRTMQFLVPGENQVLGLMLDWTCAGPAVKLAYQGQLYFLLSSREKEKWADKQAARLGSRECQASALAKTACHDLWVFEREAYESFYATPEHPRDLMTRRVEAFRQALAEREADWKTILERELPSRVDTHPTFRQRWEALGCCDYSLVPRQEDTPLARECQVLLEHTDNGLASIPAQVYQQQRAESYEEPLALVTQWEKTGELLSPDEMRPILLAYLNLGKPEKMEELCDRLLEWDSHPIVTHFAYYWKGKLLLYRYDKRGIDYIYQAMEANRNYIQPGLDAIGSYCTRMGLAQELEEYRRRAPELMQQEQDCQIPDLSHSRLAPENLPEDWLDKIRETAIRAAQGKLQKLYLVKQLASEEYQPSAVVLKLEPDATEDLVQKAYDKVFALLDDWPVDWEFVLFVYEPAMEKALNKVPGSCIYEKNGEGQL